MADDMHTLLERQKAAQLRDGAPSAEQRIERIDRCIGLLVDHRGEIEEALNADFGARRRRPPPSPMSPPRSAR